MTSHWKNDKKKEKQKTVKNESPENKMYKIRSKFVLFKLNNLIKKVIYDQNYKLIKSNTIFGATTPIIEFEIEKNNEKFEYDICYDNEFGLINTDLFKMYSSFDLRVKTLGYKIKEFSQEKNINGNRFHYLSSYSYLILM